MRANVGDCFNAARARLMPVLKAGGKNPKPPPPFLSFPHMARRFVSGAANLTMPDYAPFLAGGGLL